MATLIDDSISASASRGRGRQKVAGNNVASVSTPDNIIYGISCLICDAATAPSSGAQRRSVLLCCSRLGRTDGKQGASHEPEGGHQHSSRNGPAALDPFA